MRRPRTNSVGIVFPGILLAGHVFSFVQYQLVRNTLIDPYNSVVDARVLLLLAVVDVVFLVRFRKKALNMLFLTIQLVLILFVLTITNCNLGITVILSSVFLIACGYFLRNR